ncbi:putative cell number regulator 8-like [Capsicum annuum]|nr:putative cell number regulator 8-like [Capsicum annuum]
MELKCGFIVIFLLLLLVAPSFSSSSGKMDLSNVDTSEIYEIDYRGPETHTNIPPPRGGRHNSHHQGMLFHHKAIKPGKNGVLLVVKGIEISDVPDYPEAEGNDILPIQKAIEFEMGDGFPDDVPVEEVRLVILGWLAWFILWIMGDQKSLRMGHSKKIWMQSS